MLDENGISNRLKYFGTGEAVAMTLADMQMLYEESEEPLSPAELATAVFGYPEDEPFYAWDICEFLYAPTRVDETGGE